MLKGLAIFAACAAILSAVLLLFNAERLVGSRAGRLAVFLGLVGLPFVAIGSGTTYGVKASSKTEFCISCHEMEQYGQSLFVDDPRALPAVHYQKRLINRDETCYQCHTDYAMFGDVSAKINGLKHVWVHYLGDVPETFELYNPYPNHNCLHCHDDARGYVESPAHKGSFRDMEQGKVSCLKCHDMGHALDKVAAGQLWLGPEPAEGGPDGAAAEGGEASP